MLQKFFFPTEILSNTSNINVPPFPYMSVCLCVCLSPFKMLRCFVNLRYFALHSLFLRAARSFYDSLWYLHTYAHTYKSSFRETILHKDLLNKKVSKWSKFFGGAEIQKLTEKEPKNPLFWPKIAVYLFFLKKSSS